MSESLNIGFVSKSNPYENSGGAEQNSLGLFEHLKRKGDCNIDFISTHEASHNDIITHDAFILEDFWGLSEDFLNSLYGEKYLIFENSYGFASDKFLGFSKRENPLIEEDPLHIDLYKNAKAVLLQSWYQQTIFEVNLPDLNTLVCLDGNFWTQSAILTLDQYSSLRNWGEDIYENFDSRYIIIDGKNDLHRKVKGVEDSIKLCEERELEYEVVSFNSYEEYLKTLAGAYGLVFTPTVPETFSRVYIEAKYLGLDLITNDNLGAKRSYWGKRGTFLPHAMSFFNSLASQKVWDLLIK